MASGKKACKTCKRIYEGDKCQGCGSQEYIDDFKGRLVIMDPENSEIAKNVKIKNKGTYAIKIK
jgi:DNA-directed RNA polymerase subunit E"